MKQFLIFGLLVLLQVNFIACRYQFIQNYQDLDSDLEDINYEEEYLDGDDPSESNYYDDEQFVDGEEYFDDSQYSDNEIGQTYTQNNIQQVPWYKSDINYQQFYKQPQDPTNTFQNYIRRRRSLDLPEATVLRKKRQDDWYISVCTRSECSSRGNGYRALEKCGPAFCTCHNGNAYLQGCAIGLIYHAEKRLCTWYYNVPGC